MTTLENGINDRNMHTHLSHLRMADPGVNVGFALYQTWCAEPQTRDGEILEVDGAAGTHLTHLISHYDPFQ